MISIFTLMKCHYFYQAAQAQKLRELELQEEAKKSASTPVANTAKDVLNQPLTREHGPQNEQICDHDKPSEKTTGRPQNNKRKGRY